ncbi:MAG: glycosyltransferase family 9 protein [Desulfobacterales bacterium]|nr:glycosyltransferase family 9 protein [Desulfobacterales bacterium]
MQDTDFIIAVHPGCATSKKERTLAEAKRVWPAENYPELLKRIMKNFNAKIILTGVQKEEAEVNRQIQAQVGDGVHVISRTTINQFAYLLSKCALMLTTDTGGLHVAAAVGTPIVALSGPTTAHQYSPFVPRGFFREVAADIGCRPCNLERSCNNNLCMQKISVDDVFHAISAHLKAHRKKGSPAER